MSTDQLLREALERIAQLETALSDLVSWFPDKPRHEWCLPAGEYGADDAVAAAKAALKTEKGDT